MKEASYFSVHSYYGIESSNDHIISIPIQIGIDTLPEELEMLLRIVSKGNFVSGGLSSQVQHFVESNFIGSFPAKTLSGAEV